MKKKSKSRAVFGILFLSLIFAACGMNEGQKEPASEPTDNGRTVFGYSKE